MDNVSLLWQQYKQGSNKAKNKLIETYCNLVHIIVGRICIGNKYGIFDKEDLYNYGIIGLIEAIERFNPQQGVKFETFASMRIKGQIIDNIRKSNWLPKDVQRSIQELEKAYEELAVAGKPLTDENLMSMMGIDKEKLRKILNYANQSNLLYLDNFVQNSEEDRFIDILPDEGTNPLENLVNQDILVRLTDAIKKLSVKEQMVLNLYYYEELTLKEIGLILNLSEARISQIHSKAINRLRLMLKKEAG
ncbi:sigma-70 family RNA polymerase sigma factor [Anaerobranca gottschalkii]|uniref:RNA polymerase sigma factor for flagellar operon FliA n=1 Tax=Anaerobranca gottschalkii DSM 13577 TaxID=1120990 RepID=A0A1H9ZC16_9FIRM|nr:FliA/WhiG family RNA polymerase sigma factor [Anaerobranca gottschalkii]SES79125.1 RNA polymerase sigma factor for flagellar operon FliA [Anaerobranca gottschalkii DSM 13577]